MQLEDAINESVRQLSSLTSRRGLLAKVYFASADSSAASSGC